MIFGFNTDVKYADIVYHVQSEARQHELLLQTQVFVKGYCIGKRTTSYADQMSQPGFSEEQMHEMLKDQHKRFVAAVRDGRIEAELAEAEAAKAAAAGGNMEITEAAGLPRPVGPEFTLQPVSGGLGRGLSLDCLPLACSTGGSAVTISVQVTDDNGASAGAQVTCRITSGDSPAAHVYATCDENGEADVQVSLNGLDLGSTALLIQASFRGKSVSRKYQLLPANS